MSSLFSFLPDEIVTSIGWTLLHSLWQGCVIALLLLFILNFFRIKSANAKALLSTFALILLLAASISTFVIEYNLHRPTALITSETLPQLNIHEHISDTGIKAENTNPFNFVFTAYHQFKIYFIQNIPIIVTIWFIGFLFFAFRFAGGLYLIFRMRRSVTYVDDTYWNNRLDEICWKAMLKRKAMMAESSYTTVPILIGYFKPVILLPLGLISGLPQSQIESIIAHEVAHIKRYDIIINFFQSIAEILFFYNPFAWWISEKIRFERENSCDDIAINLCGDSVTYAKALANLEVLKESNKPLFAIPLFNNRNQLLRRIKRMLQKDQIQYGFKEKFAAVLTFIVIMAAAAILSNLKPASGSIDNKINKAGFSFPASIFVGNKEFTDIQVDTIKSSHGKRNFSYFQKENGRMVKYKARMENGKLTSLSIDGDKVPQDKLDNYRKDVEEAYSKIDKDDYSNFSFSGNKMNFFGDSMGNFINSSAYKQSMEELRLALKQNAWDMKNYFNSDESKKAMEELKEAIKENAKNWSADFNTEENKKAMEELQKAIKENSKNWSATFNSEENKKAMEELQKAIKENVKNWSNNFNSKEFKKSIEEYTNKMKEYYESPEYKKSMDNFKKSMEEYSKNMKDIYNSEDYKNSMKKFQLDMEKYSKSMKNAFNSDEYKKGMEKFNKNMKVFSDSMKVFGEKMKVFGKFMKEVHNLLVEEKIIDNDEDSVSINIKKDGIYVDDKKQSDALFEKVKKIYKKYYNKPLEGDIVISD